jgi:cellulose synthase/poly-beta-1,6-N-acetylglucosamine synthase-like glycosyltransferase
MSLAQTILVVALWICLAAVVYAYAGYPVVIGALARLFGRRRPAPEIADADLPFVSLLIAAYNEEAVIDGRIRNALDSDYPADKFEIVIATDGCADQTAAIVRRYTDRGVRLLEYPRRRGKTTVLNDSIPQLRGEVVMFSDANTYTDPGAVRNLVRWFRDPAVGAVSGKLVLTDPTTGKNADGLYWKYETFLKQCEGRLGALLGANGGIYAIRRALYHPLPTTAVLDDFLIPLLAKLRTGCDIVFEPAAVAREETAAGVSAEFQRRTRIGAGGFGSLGLLAGLLNPRRGWVAFAFLSHKILRWCCPFALLGLIVANALLALEGEPFYRLLLAAQAAFYTTALIAAYIPGQQKPVRLLRLTTMFMSMNGALLMGFGRWLRGSQAATWRRTARVAELQPAGWPAPAHAERVVAIPAPFTKAAGWDRQSAV